MNKDYPTKEKKRRKSQREIKEAKRIREETRSSQKSLEILPLRRSKNRVRWFPLKALAKIAIIHHHQFLVMVSALNKDKDNETFTVRNWWTCQGEDNIQTVQHVENLLQWTNIARLARGFFVSALGLGKLILFNKPWKETPVRECKAVSESDLSFLKCSTVTQSSRVTVNRYIW